MANPARQGIVDCGMAECALDAHGTHRAILIEDALDANDRVKPQQSQRRGWIVQIYGSPSQLADQRRRQRVDVDFQARCKRDFRAHACSNTAKSRPFNGAMQLERVPPERLTSERILPED